jgi:hypothetical protein
VLGQPHRLRSLAPTHFLSRFRPSFISLQCEWQDIGPSGKTTGRFRVLAPSNSCAATTLTGKNGHLGQKRGWAVQAQIPLPWTRALKAMTHADRGAISILLGVGPHEVTGRPRSPRPAKFVWRHIGNSDMRDLIPKLRIDIMPGSFTVSWARIYSV